MSAFGLREIRVLAKQLEPQGWTWEKTRGGHILWRGPNGCRIYSASTSGGGRGDRNLRALLRRNGAVL